MIARCERHPKYKGKRKPRTTCIECALLYLQLKSLRIPVAPPTVRFKNKSKYTRKTKHKKAANTDTND